MPVSGTSRFAKGNKKNKRNAVKLPVQVITDVSAPHVISPYLSTSRQPNKTGFDSTIKQHLDITWWNY